MVFLLISRVTSLTGFFLKSEMDFLFGFLV